MKPQSLPMVYLVDDEEVVRDALSWLLRSRRLLSEGFGSAELFESMLDALPRQGVDWPSAPSCLLLDVRMPGMSGLALFDRLIERGLLDTLPVIFLTGHGDVPTAVEKPFSDNALVDRVEHALAQSAAAIEARDVKGALGQRVGDLTEREREVMLLVVQGLPNKLIADQLNISVRTVEVHRARVFEKMNVKSAVELSNLLRGDNAAHG